jgi:Tol biopolymer transport system component
VMLAVVVTLGAVSAHAAGAVPRVNLGDSTSGERAAATTHLYYACGPNICVAEMSGADVVKRSRVSTNGTASTRYTSPSISRGGTRLAYIYGNTVYTASPVYSRNLHVNTALVALIRPDGAKVAAINEQQEAGGSLVPYLVDVNFNGSGYENVSRFAITAGWLGTSLLRDDDRTPHQSICVVLGNGTCGRDVAVDSNRDLWDPSVSPNGSLVAATAAPPDGVHGKISLYGASSGQFVRNVTKGTTDSHPTWSPDGKTIAFSRGTGVYEVAATGGTPHLVASNAKTPSWGN